MLKGFLKILFIILGSTIAFNANAQIADPTTWTYEARKTDAGEYELVFHLQLEEGWHIWSLDPGGDGFQIPPSFSIDKSVPAKLVDKPVEQGEKITTEMDGVDGKVNYFSNKVDFVQKVKASAGANITGTHEYQVCNDRMCLPPKTQKFKFEISE